MESKRNKTYDARVFDVSVLDEDGSREFARFGVRFGEDKGEGERLNSLLFLELREKDGKNDPFQEVLF